MDTVFPGIDADTPIYQLLVDHFLDDDTLHMAGEQIAYDGPPSEHMAPLNAPARARVQEMLDQLDYEARKKAALVGREYRGRLTDLGDVVDQVRRDAEVLQKRAMPVVPTGEVPLRPDMEPLALRRQRIKRKTKIRASRAPAAQQRPAPQPISGKLGNYEPPSTTAPLQGE